MGQDLLFLLIIVPESVVNIFYSIFQRHIVILVHHSSIRNRLVALI